MLLPQTYANARLVWFAGAFRANRWLLAVVSQPAGIPGMRSEHRSQKNTRTQDDHITENGWEQARDHHETKPEQPGKD